MHDLSHQPGRTDANGALADETRQAMPAAAKPHAPRPRADRAGPDSRAAGEVLVGLDGVGVRRGGRWLVRGVSFDIRRGEIVTLIGPNGSGKSTTARTIVGILKADEGTVARRDGVRVGYVPQKLAIDRTLPLTVARLMTLTARHDPAEIAAALDEVGIPHLAGAQVQSLSGGEFQRALLARAMLRRPDLLVLDEPVQGVDYTGEAALYELIGRVRDRTGCGVLLISHDLHIVMAATDTVICLNGHVCCRGTPQAVASDPQYRQLFGRRAAAALAVYSHHHDHTHLADGRVLHADGSVTDNCHPQDGHHGDHHGGHHEGHHGDHGHGLGENGDAR